VFLVRALALICHQPAPGDEQSRTPGFRTLWVAELGLCHSLGKLPEPELTHRFFSRVNLRYHPPGIYSPGTSTKVNLVSHR